MRDLRPALNKISSRESEALRAGSESMERSRKLISLVPSGEEDFVEDRFCEAIRIIYDAEKTGIQPPHIPAGRLLRRTMNGLEGVKKNLYFAMYHCD
ncbi:unnamed protein product [Agarophyton chilense]